MNNFSNVFLLLLKHKNKPPLLLHIFSLLFIVYCLIKERHSEGTDRQCDGTEPINWKWTHSFLHLKAEILTFLRVIFYKMTVQFLFKDSVFFCICTIRGGIRTKVCQPDIYKTL